MTATHIPPDDPATRALLRHALATLAYRAGKTVRGTPEAFAEYLAAPGSNSPRTILAHMGDLMDWCLCMARDGERNWTTATPLPWEQEQARFFAAVGALDAQLASNAPLRWDPGELFQGGIADALTHTGQLAMLRRLSGHKMQGENTRAPTSWPAAQGSSRHRRKRRTSSTEGGEAGALVRKAPPPERPAGAVRTRPDTREPCVRRRVDSRDHEGGVSRDRQTSRCGSPDGDRWRDDSLATRDAAVEGAPARDRRAGRGVVLGKVERPNWS